MNKVLIIHKDNKIEEKDINFKKIYLKDFLYSILKGGYKALNKTISNIDCTVFYINDYESKKYNEKYNLGEIVIVKLDLLNGYIDNRGNYECYFGFNEEEILEIKKYIILSRKSFFEVSDTYKGKSLIYIDENFNFKNIHINKDKENIKELIINLLGENYLTIPFKVNGLECSIWFNDNNKCPINKLGFKFLEIGHINGSIIISKYCTDYRYIVGEGTYTLDDGFTKEEWEGIIEFLKNI